MIKYRLYPLTSAFYWTGGAVALLLLGLFLWTMSATVYFEDSGLFGMVCYYWGVAHPPMYPLYTMLCPSFAHLPFITPIHGVAIFSALNAVLACFLIALIVVRLSGMVVAGAVAALIYGVSDSFWAQAIIQEVYTLNSALFFLALWRVLEFAYRPSARNFHWMVFLSVLGLSNHWPLMMLSAVGFPLIILPVWREFFYLWFSRHGWLAVGSIVAALSPYVVMWWRSLSEPVISFYGPIDSWSLFWFVITRQGYSGVDNAGGNWLDKEEYLRWLFESMMMEQTTWAGVICAALGLVFLWRIKRVMLCLGLLVAMLGGSVLLVLLLDFKFTDFSRSIFRVYPLVSWGILALLTGLGVAMIGHWSRQFVRHRQSYRRFLRFGSVVFLLIPAWLVAANFHKNNQPSVTWAHKWAMTILQSLEKNAIVFTHDDTHLPFMYLHSVEGVREDVTLYNTQSLIFDNRLTKARIHLKKKMVKYLEVARTTSRPFYTFYESENPYGGYWNGVYYQGDRNLKKGEKVYRLEPVWFDQLIDGVDAFRDNNGWSRNQKVKQAHQLSELLLKMPFDTSGHMEAREKILSVPFAQLAYASSWFQHRVPVSEEALAFELVDRVEPLVQFLPSYQQARHYNTYARVHSVRASQVDYQRIEKILLKGLEAYDGNDNPSLYTLLELYAQTKNKEAFEKYDALYPNGARGSAIVAAYRKGENYRPPPPINEQDAKKMLDKALGFLRDEPRKPDEALRLATELEKYYAHVPSVNFLLGGARMMRQEYDLAEKAFLRTIQLKPDHVSAKVNLVHVYLHTKKYDLLAQLLEKSLQEHPGEKRLLKAKERWQLLEEGQKKEER